MEEAPGRVVFEVPCPEVALGRHRFDIRHRAVVVGVLDGSLVADVASLVTAARGLVADGAAALEVPAGPGLTEAVHGLRGEVDVPICVVTGEPEVLDRALGAGAVVGVDPSGCADPGWLEVAAAAGASVVVRPAAGEADLASVAQRLRAQAERAEDAGISRSRVVVDSGLELMPGGPAALGLLRGDHSLAALGWPLALTVRGAHGADDRAASIAAVAAGIAQGARLLRVSDARGARRATDVVAAILRARTARSA